MSSRLLKSSRSNSVDPSANGCLDEEQFLASFVDVPKLNLYSQKDVTDKLTKIKEILNNASQDWDKRCLALKEIRSLIVQDQMRQLPDLQQQIRFLDIGLQTSLKDLRSQVVREACITVSYMAREFGGRFEYSAEPILQVLVPLMQNSAKVMATSAHTSIKFIIKAIHSPKLTTTIISNMSSKSNVIRKHCCEFVHIILNEWSRQELEKQSHALQQAITKGLSDADSEARYFSRKAFASFSMVFPEQGYSILSSFDASKQKQLLSELDDPNFFDSMSQFKTPVSKGRGVAPDLVASATPKAKASRFGFTPKPAANVFKTPATPKMTTPQRGVMAKVDTGMRSKFKVSQSTPTSRTGSPSRTPLRAANHPPPDVTPVACRTPLYGTLRTPRSVARNGSSVRKITSQSQCNSREVSPTRRMVVKSRPLLSGAVSGTLCTEGNGGNFSSMRSLPQSPCPDNIVEYGRNLEAAISDAWRQKANWFRSSDDVDAYSETSSVCSETSSYRSHSDMTEDTLGIMSRLVCGLWTERKEGLMMLQKFLRCGKRFNNAEIRKVLDIIMRMFHDSHPKVLASFFEVLADLVQAHHQDMMDLLPSIFSRLFSKAVSDVLGNLHDKISRTLDAIRISFPCDKQLAAVCKYITEQPATISIKAKQTILLYFLNLSSAIEPSALTNTSDIRASISKILTWTSEPKNAEVRKLSQSTIVTLARNCPDQLNAILSLMPKTYQDGAKKILSDQLGNNVNNNSHGTPVSGKTQKVVPRAHTPRSIFAVVEPRRGTPTKNAGQSDDGVDIWDGIAKASEELQQLSLLEVEELNEGLLEDSSHSMHVCNQDGDAETDLGNLLETIKDSKEVTEWCGLVNCLISFIKASNSRELWNIHFKMTYALILEAIQDAESPQRKLLGLQALREMLEKHSERFHPYAELTIMNLLETEKEKDRDVIRASDECRLILSRAFPLEQSIGILNPICLTATYPINMAAVKLLTKVFQFAPTEQIRDHVPVVAPGLVKGFEHEESGMRKSSMLCLVAIHKHIGEELMSYIKDLSQNKMKLLNVYIRKSSGEGD